MKRRWHNVSKTLGEHPTCTCGLPAIGGTCLDPFGGSGTMAEVALEYGRRAILIELKPEYVELQKRRLAPVAGRPMLDFTEGA
jgi:16S rRNA G966 N2-methylase RsmD